MTNDTLIDLLDKIGEKEAADRLRDTLPGQHAFLGSPAFRAYAQAYGEAHRLVAAHVMQHSPEPVLPHRKA